MPTHTEPRFFPYRTRQLFDLVAGVEMMTNTGKIIRCPVEDIRIAGRATQGVTIFKVEPKEKVVSAVRIDEAAVAEADEPGETEHAAQ